MALGEGISLVFQASVQDAIKNLDALQSKLESFNQSKPFSDAAMSAADLSSKMEEVGGVLGDTLFPINDIAKAFSGMIAPVLSAVDAVKKVYSALNKVDKMCDSALGKIKSFAKGVWDFEKTVWGSVGSLLGFGSGAEESTDSVSSFSSSIFDLIKGIAGIKITSDFLSEAISSVSSYTQNIRFFTVSLGDYAGQAYQYAKNISEVLGIDLSDFLRYEALFNELSTSMGVTADKAYLMSQNLGQLTYDLASYMNYDPSEVATKFQNAIGGEARGLRKLGIDISESTLQQVLYAHGINKTVSSLTAAQKAQLRYITIMEQSSNAMGNFAQTALSPATSLRILANQVQVLARSVGNVLVPALSIIVPICVTIIQALTKVFNAIASFFGVSVDGLSSVSGGLSGVSSDAEDASNALGGAAGKAKELKRYLAGFDELNVIDLEDDSSSGGGSGGSSGGGGGDLGIDLPQYDMLSGITKKASDSLSKFFDPFEKAWKNKGLAVTNAFKASINSIKALSKSVGDAWNDAWSGRGYKYAESLYSVIENIFRVISSVSDSITDANKAGDKLKSVFSSCIKLVTNINGAISQIAGTVASAIKESGKGTVIVQNILSFVKNIVDTADNLTTAFRNAWDKGGSYLVNGLLNAYSGITGFYKTVSATIESITKNSGVITSFFERILNIGAAVGNTIGSIGKKFSEIWEGAGVGRAIVEGFFSVLNTLASFFEMVANAASEMWGGIAGSSMAQTVLAGLQFIINACQRFANALTEIWEPHGRALFEALGLLLSEIVRLAETIIGQIVNNAAGSLESTLPGIIDFITAIVVGLQQVIQWLNEHPAVLNMIMETIKSITTAILAIKVVIDIIIGVIEGIIGLVVGVVLAVIGDIVRLIIDFFSLIIAGFAELASWIASLDFSAIGESIVGFFTSIGDAITGFVNWVNDVGTNFLNGVGDFFSGIWNGIISVVSTVGNWLREKITGIWDSIKSVTSSVWEGIKKAITSPIETARDTVRRIIDAIRGFFDFSISWPHIPMPHFRVKPDGWGIGDLLKGEIPSLSIDWYAAGGFPETGKLFIANEAGPELVGNIGARTAVANNDQIVAAVSQGVAQAVASVLNQGRSSGSSESGNIILQVDGQTFGKIAINTINKRQRVAGIRLLEL